MLSVRSVLAPLVFLLLSHGAIAQLTSPQLTSLTRTSAASLAAGSPAAFSYSITVGPGDTLTSVGVVLEDASGNQRQMSSNGAALSGALATAATWLNGTYKVTRVVITTAATDRTDFVRDGTVVHFNNSISSPTTHTVPLANADFTLTGGISPLSFATQPQSQGANAGSSVTFSTTVAGTAPFTYQWRRNGTAISGATSSTYTIPSVQTSDAGNYDVVVTSSLNSITSNAATLVVGTASLRALINLSVRANVFAGSSATGSFTISSESPKKVLIRAVGPTLGTFGLSGTMADPQLVLKDSTGQIVASNDNWGSAANLTDINQATSNVGAFGLSSSSKDAAILTTLNPGTYSATVSGGSSSGIVLFELYDADSARISTFTYLAYEGSADSGANSMIAGFVTTGTQPLDVLVRAMGPSLGTAGLTDPRLDISNMSGGAVGSNDNWGGDGAIAATTTLVGASAFAASGKESALIKSLTPGGYTAVVSGANSSSGTARLEVFALAPGTLQSYVPTITKQPANVTAASGSAVSFSVEASTVSPAAVRYQWRKSGVDIAGATNATYSITGVAPADTGSYDVVVSTAVGFATSSPATLNISGPAVFATQPQSQGANAGSSVTFSTTVAGTAPFTYQWRRNGTAISGATSSTYAIPSVQTSDAGSYDVVVTSSLNSITSNAATLVVGTANVRALINLSVRANIFAGGSATGSFTISSESPKKVLIRAVGPSLATFGLSGTMSDPQLVLKDSTGQVVASNDNWGSAANAAEIAQTTSNVGAFPLSSSSKDAVILTALNPGTYSATVSGGSSSGMVLFELYDADSARFSTFTYLAYEGSADSGANPMIAGFVTTGTQPLDVLVRAMGPSLGTAGLTDPRLDISNMAGGAVGSNDNWGGDGAITAATTLIGASAFAASGKESALIKSLTPGGYTAVVSGANSSSGTARLEVFAIPVRDFHSSDSNHDGRLSLLELTRTIEIYNVRNGTLRTGSYAPQAGSEDGFALDATRNTSTAVTFSTYHSADTNRDGKLSLYELTRVIELYNSRSGTSRTGQYKPQIGSEDGFAPGP